MRATDQSFNNVVETLTFPELVKVQTKIAKLLAGKRNETRRKLRAKLAEEARAHGFDLTDLVGKAPKPTRQKSPSKVYANPENPAQVWNGVGRAPKWFSQKTALQLQP